MNANEQENQNPTPPEPPKIACEVRENGSLLIHGMIDVTMPDGTVVSKGPARPFAGAALRQTNPFATAPTKPSAFRG